MLLVIYFEVVKCVFLVSRTSLMLEHVEADNQSSLCNNVFANLIITI